jgi:acetyl esterase/lipase
MFSFRFSVNFIATLLLFTAAAHPQAPAQTQPVPVQPLPHGQIEYLWPNGAPGAVGTEDSDKPRLEIFSGQGPGPHSAVIVCPGGSYTRLGYDGDGVRVAEWLNLRGVTAFVLTYRLMPGYKYPSFILDGQRSVRWVRSHAQQYAVDPKHIGMWGFSAGGHLAGMVGTHFDDGNPQAPDPIDRVSDRPDFVISAYGVLTLDEDIARPEAIYALLGDQTTRQLLDYLSPDKNVTPETPPFFIYATSTDPNVPVLSSVALYSALVKAGVDAEMHLFQRGPHGTGLAQNYPALSEWPSLLENWLRLNGWIRQRDAGTTR